MKYITQEKQELTVRYYKGETGSGKIVVELMAEMNLVSICQDATKNYQRLKPSPKKDI